MNGARIKMAYFLHFCGKKKNDSRGRKKLVHFILIVVYYNMEKLFKAKKEFLNTWTKTESKIKI